MVASAVGCLFLFMAIVFSATFLLLRRTYRQRLKKRLDPGFYPSTRSLGEALHTLQIFAQPQIQHVLQEKRSEPKQEEEDGGE